MDEKDKHLYGVPQRQLTDDEYLQQQSVFVGTGKPDGETLPYRDSRFPDNLVQYPIHCDTGKPLGGKTLHETMQINLKINGPDPFLGHRVVNADGTFGDYVWEDYSTVGARIKRVGCGLMKHNLKTNSKVGIYSINRPEWIIAEYGSYYLSAVPVALYDTLGAHAVEYVINHADCEAVVCTANKIEKLLHPTSNWTNLKLIVVMEPEIFTDEQLAQAQKLSVSLVTLKDLEKLGEDNPAEPIPPTPDTPATIMYTSGSTGNPKGVVLSHSNIVALVLGVTAHKTTGPSYCNKARHLSYLPLAHSFERASCSCVITGGGSIGFFSGKLPNLLDDMANLHPGVLCGAPRVYQRIHDRITLKMSQAPTVRRFIFEFCKWWKEDVMRRDGDLMAHSTHWTDSIVFKKTKELLGGQVGFLISGSAPLDPALHEFLRVVFCAPVIQGYGLTETSAAVSLQIGLDSALGHVGPPIACTELKLIDVPEMGYLSTDDPPRGEICARGPNVFVEYFKDPEKTAECMSEDGWFQTGDIGCLLPSGVTQVIDRRKNIFKLSQGEYVAAEHLETIYARVPLVAQIFVYGDSFKNCLVAVVVPDVDRLIPLAVENGFLPSAGEDQAADMKLLCESKAVRDLIHGEMKEKAAENSLQGFEIVKAIHLEPELFSVENNLLTPSFKQKRPQLKSHYKAAIDTLYSGL